MTEFQTKVAVIFGPIMKRFGFRQVDLNDTSVALLKEEFALIVDRDRDGVAVRYVGRDEKTKAVIQHPLDHFLVTRRRWVISEKFEPIDKGIDSYALTLEQTCQDMLSGDKSWLNSITTQPHNVDRDTQKALGFTFGSHISRRA
ncbi:MAG: hypothetical protein ACO1TE_02585 [Prosthecobacter sp.]